MGDLSLGLEVTALQHQQDYLENLISIRIATPEIANLAKKIVRESNQYKVWERKILYQRLQNKRVELLRARSKWRRSTARTEALLPGQLAAVFRGIKKQMEKVHSKN